MVGVGVANLEGGNRSGLHVARGFIHGGVWNQLASVWNRTNDLSGRWLREVLAGSRRISFSWPSMQPRRPALISPGDPLRLVPSRLVAMFALAVVLSGCNDGPPACARPEDHGLPDEHGYGSLRTICDTTFQFLQDPARAQVVAIDETAPTQWEDFYISNTRSKTIHYAANRPPTDQDPTRSTRLSELHSGYLSVGDYVAFCGEGPATISINWKEHYGLSSTGPYLSVPACEG